MESSEATSEEEGLPPTLDTQRCSVAKDLRGQWRVIFVKHVLTVEHLDLSARCNPSERGVEE